MTKRRNVKKWVSFKIIKNSFLTFFIAPEIYLGFLGVPLRIPSVIGKGFPSEVKQGIYPGALLEDSTEITYGIPSGSPYGFRPVILWEISPWEINLRKSLYQTAILT